MTLLDLIRTWHPARRARRVDGNRPQPTPRPAPPGAAAPGDRDYIALIGSTINGRVLQALCQTAGGIPIKVVVECDYPDDTPPGLMMLFTGHSILWLLTGTRPVWVNDVSYSPAVAWWLGYVGNADSPLIERARTAPDRALEGWLIEKNGAWTVRVAAPPGLDQTRD